LAIFFSLSEALRSSFHVAVCSILSFLARFAAAFS
jgi:hypothetical protein